MQTWYYSSSGERQGPVSFEELKTMARSGRLNPTVDLAWTEGMTDWKPSGQISGLFQDGSGGFPAVHNPYAAPATPSHDLLAPVVGREIEPGSYQLDVLAVIKRSAELTKRNFWRILGIGLVYFILSMLSSAIQQWILRLSDSNPVVVGILTLASGIFSTFLALGLAKVALNVVTGKEVSAGLLFSQGDRVLRTLGASILYFLMVAVGLVLLVVPGIYLALRFMMYQQAIIDRNLGVMDSLRYSSELTKNNRFNLFLLGLLSFLVVLAGALALFVGLVFAIPVVTLALAVAYRSLQYGQTALADQPGTTTPQLLPLTGPF